jgi:hypothetical protein
MRQVSLLILLSIIILTSACAVKRVQVGNYDKKEGKATVIAKGKDFYLFWDQIPLKRVEKKIDVNDYEKVSRRKFFDVITFYGTLGIFSFYTVEIYAEKAEHIQKGSINGKSD